jgi:hypothetical protein
MDRRTLLRLIATSLTGATAGCTNTASGVSGYVEDQANHSTTRELEVKISSSGSAITIQPIDGLPVKTRLLQDGEEKLTVEMSGTGRTVYQDIIDCEAVHDPEQRSFNPGTIKLVFIDMDGNKIGSRLWKFDPSPVVEEFTIATVSSYNSKRFPSETTPVFKLHNKGTGPTCLDSIEITNPQKSVTLHRPNEKITSPMLRTGTYDITDSKLSIFNTPTENQTLHPAGSSYEFALEGLFSVNNPPDARTHSNIPNKLNQTFDVVIHTAYGATHTTTIDIAMVGGVTKSHGTNSRWNHRYRTIRFEQTKTKQ